jgi:hypothetical protein
MDFNESRKVISPRNRGSQASLVEKQFPMGIDRALHVEKVNQPS